MNNQEKNLIGLISTAPILALLIFPLSKFYNGHGLIMKLCTVSYIFFIIITWVSFWTMDKYLGIGARLIASVKYSFFFTLYLSTWVVFSGILMSFFHRHLSLSKQNNIILASGISTIIVLGLLWIFGKCKKGRQN